MIETNKLTTAFKKRNLFDIDAFKKFFDEKVSPYFKSALDAGAKQKNAERAGNYTKDAIYLTAFFLFKRQNILKQSLSELAKECRGDDNVEDCQARHLAKQSGYNIRIDGEEDVEKGCYMLIDGNISPRFTKSRTSILPNDQWEEMLSKFDGRCATCGHKEGEISPFDGKAVKLQRGHKDPTQDVSKTNIIPLCEWHNRYYCNRNKQPIYDEKGQIIEFVNI